MNVDADSACSRCHDRTGCGKCSAELFMIKIGIDGVILTKMDGDTTRWCCTFHQGRNRQADPVCRYGREAFGSGTVLSGTYGFQNPWYGRCNEPDREGRSICGSGTGPGDAKKLKKMDFDFNDYLDQHGADEQDGWYFQYPEHASWNGRAR